jgi:hypothetical protein
MNPRYPSLTVAIKSPRPRGGGAGQYGLVLIILPDDQRSMVRRVVGANEAGGKEGPRGGIFLRFRAQDENAANAVDLQPTHNGGGMFILMVCEPAEAVTRLRAVQRPLTAPRCGGWVVATRCQASGETGSLPPLGWEAIDQRAAGSRRLSSSSTTPAITTKAIAGMCAEVPRRRRVTRVVAEISEHAACERDFH